MTVIRALLVGSVVVFLLALGCTANKIPAPVDGEPLCPDFELGASHTKMKGGLRKPIRVTVLDGHDPVSTRVLLGRRTADDAPAKLSIENRNETYDIEWAQCENERAPRPVKGESAGNPRDTAAYGCGEAKAYSTSKHTIKRGEQASFVIQFVAPPTAECWNDSVPEAGSASPATDAGTRPAGDNTVAPSGAPADSSRAPGPDGG